MEKQKSLFVVCVNNYEYPASLELHKIYQVLPDEHAIIDGDIRVIDESGEDYLYPAEWFVVIDLPEMVEHSMSTSPVLSMSQTTRNRELSLHQ
jgi:hypothetical protein